MPGSEASARPPSTDGSCGTGRQPMTPMPQLAAASSRGGACGPLRVGVLREEAHRHGEVGAVVELVAEGLKVVLQQLERHLDGDAGAVTGSRVGRDGAAVGEVDDGLDGQLDDAPRALAADLGDEAGTAGVVLEVGVVEPRPRGIPALKSLRGVGG